MNLRNEFLNSPKFIAYSATDNGDLYIRTYVRTNLLSSTVKKVILVLRTYVLLYRIALYLHCAYVSRYQILVFANTVLSPSVHCPSLSRERY